MHERESCAAIAVAVAVAIASVKAVANKSRVPQERVKIAETSDSKLASSTGPSTS